MLLVSASALVGIALAAPQSSPTLQGPGWDPGCFLHGVPGARVVQVYDDGTRPALYVANQRIVDGQPVGSIARWNGSEWTPLGPGLTTTGFNRAEVHAMAVFDGGSGSELYVGGFFERAGSVVLNGIARWNGTRWASVGSPAGPAVSVWALTVFDDGGGPALYAGGQFPSIGGTAARGVARWDGASWTPLGGGFESFHGSPGRVLALAGYGGQLHAGGEFPFAEGTQVNNIARWDGSKWRKVGEGARRQFASVTNVRALKAYREGDMEYLAIGGDFDHLGGKPMASVGRWNGQGFDPVGGGLPFGDVHTLETFDDGRGTALFAGGTFFLPKVLTRVSVARFDGRSWKEVGAGLSFASAGVGEVQGLGVFDPGTGPTLFAAGSFGFSGLRVVVGLAELRAGEWYPPGTPGQGVENDINGGDRTPITSFAVFDDGGGEDLYAGGNFERVGESFAQGVARWDGGGWSTVLPGSSGLYPRNVEVLQVFDDGTGPALYAGGLFDAPPDFAVGAVGRWDGSDWEPLGGGLGAPGLGFFPAVLALQSHDDGSGPALYVGGAFSEAGGVSVNGIARWDGTTWSDVGGGFSDFTTPVVHALAVFDDGSGPVLIAGGGFDGAGGIPVHGIAQWDGAGWSDVGGGLGSSSDEVRALVVFDDGSGPALYAGGRFSVAGGVSARNLARWDGSAWTALGLNGQVLELAVHDDGTGPALYAGGEFTRTFPDNQVLLRIGRRDGTSWSSLGSGLDGSRFPRVEALATFGPRGVPDLYVGGHFDTASGVRSVNFARWLDPRRRFMR